MLYCEASRSLPQYPPKHTPMDRKVDIAIIGAGTAGLNAMAQARKADRSFVLIDGGELGTTCARVGCMPSKVLIQVAEDYHRRKLFGRHGIEGAAGLRVDLEAVMEHVRHVRDIFVDRVLASSTDNLEEELIQGYARFVDPHTLEIDDGTRVHAGAIVIATGSTPVVPEAWAESFGERILTSDTLFEQERLPASIGVIGMGVVGLELGQALHRLGIETYGIDQEDTLAHVTDPVVLDTAVEVIGREFPLWLGHPAELSEAGDRLRIRAGDHEATVEAVLCAMGRRPNLDRLGLEAIGAALDERGIPRYDPRTMRLEGFDHLYIAGDVTGHRPILHEAGDEGKIAGYNAAHDRPVAFRRKPAFAITFCDPNIVHVGLHWAELEGRDDVAVGQMPIGPVGRALIMAQNKGMIRLYAERRGGRLLGASLCAPRGEHLGHALAWALRQELTVFDLLKMPFYHPVMEEALQAALYNLVQNVEGRHGPLMELDPLD